MKLRQIISKALSPKPHEQQTSKKPALSGPPTYRLSETPLGEGGYGKVYEASVDGHPHMRVAVKKIPLTRVKEESLQREVRIGRELNHPNIARVLDSYKEGEHFCVVMELVKGGELFDRVIQLGVMSEGEAATHFGQLLLAVHHCHAKGVAHRDIKLENVLLQPSGQLKLIDFGLAALHDVLNGRPVPRVLKDKCGSKSYAAPEVNTGKGYNGFAADVWSCGICLFAMLAGFFPLDEAKEVDWRFRRFVRAEAAGESACATIFSFYNRSCPFSAGATELLETMLRANPFERLRVDELLASPWLRAHAAPRVRAMIELTLNPLPLALANRERLEELLRPHSAPVSHNSRVPAAATRQPLTPPSHAQAHAHAHANAAAAAAAAAARRAQPQPRPQPQPQPQPQPAHAPSSLHTNLERAYAAFAAVVAPHARTPVAPEAGAHATLRQAARGGSGVGARGRTTPTVPDPPVAAPPRERDSRKRRPPRTPPTSAATIAELHASGAREMSAVMADAESDVERVDSSGASAIQPMDSGSTAAEARQGPRTRAAASRRPGVGGDGPVYRSVGGLTPALLDTIRRDADEASSSPAVYRGPSTQSSLSADVSVQLHTSLSLQRSDSPRIAPTLSRQPAFGASSGR